MVAYKHNQLSTAEVPVYMCRVAAIRFVLNDAFINMRGDERLQLLHVG